MSKLNQSIDSWNVCNALIMIFGTVVTIWTSELKTLAGLFSGSLIYLLFLNWRYKSPTTYLFGVGNWLTFARFVIIIIGLILIPPTESFTLFILLSIAVSLDFFDGKVARYFKEDSFFGQYFDMEIDAFFVLTMCCYYYLHTDFPMWILIPGILRYIFRIYTFLFPKKKLWNEEKNMLPQWLPVFS
jgi:phosphatidylserine synthase